jgi:hypothetical protein
MSQDRADELAADMERVNRALSQTRVHLAGLDQADGARELAGHVSYSPLRTLVEQAEEVATRVTAYLQGGI